MKQAIKLPLSLFLISYSLFLLSSCSINKQISKQASNLLLADTAIRHGHIGISIFEPATGKYWYNHDAEKYFVPASNTKLFSLYAGMKYLGDSIIGIQFNTVNDTTYILPTGDPTFLLPEFKRQPIADFLKTQSKLVLTTIGEVRPYGNGWAWNDYIYDYMAPRSVFPIYGNLLNAKWLSKGNISVIPGYFLHHSQTEAGFENGFNINKPFDTNNFSFTEGSNKSLTIPFTPDLTTIGELLTDTFKLIVTTGRSLMPGITKKIYSQHADSLFKPMMHRSDNFFAEQTLLMASQKKIGFMNERAMIDTLLKTDLGAIPQKPRWVDGSGLSRYNLFTPKDFVYLLQKLKTEFAWERIKAILPTGGEGTISTYYQSEAGYIFAKTGTLSNNCALSGFLITKKNKLLIFSILSNNYQTSATPVRRAVEKFLKGIREKY